MKNALRYRNLGKSDVVVSEVSFGCMSLGEDQKQNHYLLRQAIDQGINFFDTADLYQKGENEKSVGKALKEIRQQVVIATKVGNQWRPDGSGWDWNPSKAYILQAVEKSLQRLQTDYLDLYQLHGGTLDDPIDETIEAFELLKQQGKIRAYGISSIRPNVIREYIKRSHIQSVMMQYSLLDRRPEETCLNLLKENQISVLARGSLAQGLLAGKAPKTYLNYSPAEVAQAAAAVKSLAPKNGGAAAVAVKYVLQNPAVTAAVLGIRTEGQLQEAVQILNTPPLPNEEIFTLSQVLPPNIYEQHR
ncbi:D-threo-aldose 1-dehydrogenase [Adhaeribacter aerolatus]|uniref:D-threo-aldose 1-dehydrogenase n=1 Tax=Adhaeribacter aerolatus TaxID=670289 RepID=A0A512AZJ6_9BACT|nr:aldo/keto reductase [Adhaeribacter aerolatus]GEO04947.1 D-threo-aldose 1-dehydrogenase [Adhaeribacter aerolatus]